MTQDGFAFAARLTRESGLRIVVELGVTPGCNRLNELQHTHWVGGIALQAAGECRHQRVDRSRHLILVQSELPRQSCKGVAALGLPQNAIQIHIHKTLVLMRPSRCGQLRDIRSKRRAAAPQPRQEPAMGNTRLIDRLRFGHFRNETLTGCRKVQLLSRINHFRAFRFTFFSAPMPTSGEVAKDTFRSHKLAEYIRHFWRLDPCESPIARYRSRARHVVLAERKRIARFERAVGYAGRRCAGLLPERKDRERRL